MQELEIRKIKLYECRECCTRHKEEIEAYRCCIALQTAEGYVVTNRCGERLSRAWWYDVGDAISEYLNRCGEVTSSFNGSVEVNINFEDGD